MTETQPIRLLIADDHLILRYGLVAFIDQQPDMRVVGEASNGQEVVDLFRQHKPDVTLMDLRMPGTSGVEAIVAIRKIDPSARVIVLTIHKGDEAAYQALRAGARGYLIKDVPTKEIVAAIRDVYAGKRAIPPAIAEQLAQRIGRAGLSAREADVLKLIANGLSNKEVANELGVTEATAKKHMTGVLLKLGARDRTHAVRIGLERGILSFEG